MADGRVGEPRVHDPTTAVEIGQRKGDGGLFLGGVAIVGYCRRQDCSENNRRESVNDLDVRTLASESVRLGERADRLQPNVPRGTVFWLSSWISMARSDESVLGLVCRLILSSQSGFVVRLQLSP
jgi:hypothetical protein